MLAHSQTSAQETDPFVLYAQSLHDYTLRLWTESRRVAEEKSRKTAGAAAMRKQDERRRHRKMGSLSVGGIR